MLAPDRQASVADDEDEKDCMGDVEVGVSSVEAAQVLRPRLLVSRAFADIR